MSFSYGWWHPHHPILYAWLFGESSVGRCVAWIALCRVIGTSVVGKTDDPFPIKYDQLPVWPSAAGWLLIVAFGVRFLPSMELKLRLVQSLVGLRVAGLVGAARREPNALTYLPMHALVLPAYVLCMAWSMVCVGLHRARAWPVGPCAWSHHRPRTAPPEWRQALRVCPTQLFSSVTTGVILRNKALVCAAGNHFWWHRAYWFCATSPLRPRCLLLAGCAGLPRLRHERSSSCPPVACSSLGGLACKLPLGWPL
ncbi:hypothetical protein V6N12_035396 [Hibiscus sabdariffa]|uniref:Polyprenol reductase n=1 Tax=Hibiscus sabdariffa TaxID=183260 RepID=A0ABR2EMM1_9ROSI